MKRKSLLLSMSISLTLALVLVISCASLKTNTYKTLFISRTTYDTAMSISADLYKQGKISEAQKTQIISIANKYKDAHNAAVAAFKKADSSGLLTDRQDYLTKLSKASAILSDLLSYVKHFM